MESYWVITLLIVVFGQLASAKTGLCEVEGGQSNIILDIEESRGQRFDQETSPVQLPISGDPLTDVSLDLVFPKGIPYFSLNGKRLQLLSPLDRDKDNLSHIVFQLTCTTRSSNKKRTIPVIVRVVDVNDNAPEFINTPYNATISEDCRHTEGCGSEAQGRRSLTVTSRTAAAGDTLSCNYLVIYERNPRPM